MQLGVRAGSPKQQGTKLSIVQSAQGLLNTGVAGSFNVVLGGAPTAPDLLLAFVSYRGAVAPTIAGFTKFADAVSGGSGVDNSSAYSRVAQGGDSATWAVNAGGSGEGYNAAVIYEIAGVHPATPVPASGVLGSGTNVVAPTVTANYPKCMPFACVTGDNGSGFTATAGWNVDQSALPNFHVLGALSRPALTTGRQASDYEVVNPTLTVTGDGFYSSGIVVLVAPGL